MDEPLLSSLCTICHIDPPKYTCPRCSVQTCSLKCSKRHKLWASCNGVRDPTVFKPISEVAIAAGIDHDYNFIHGIETRIQRSEKRLIEDLGIVEAEDLERARMGIDGRELREQDDINGKEYARGEAQIEKFLKDRKIRVIKAPKGMRRNTENTTNWSRKQRCMNWQVEWIRAPNAERTLYKVLDKFPLGNIFDVMFEEERKLNMTPEEKTAERKRKATGRGSKHSKRPRLQQSTITAVSTLQNPETSAWNMAPIYTVLDAVHREPPPPEKHRDYHFYLHRPLTPASYPKVLVPLDTDQRISELIRNRDVMEFPTVHVLEEAPEHLPPTFMLEKTFLEAVGGKVPKLDTDTEMSGMNGSGDSDESSDSDDDSDSSVEEGEISE